METNRFIRLRKIFDEAILQPASEWESFLQRTCGNDATLLTEARELLLAHLNDLNEASTRSTSAGDASPRIRGIGPYRIVRELGAGGMGVVYLAVRDDGAFRKTVAVKLLQRSRASASLIQRFHQERQVLANLDHPNIARLLDGGQTAEGLPYYVMEYIEGLTLDRFCDTQKLDLADRIRLFQQVVAAVQYLHNNLVVHRDLKHSNILVTADGQVKLLDFGIAKTQTPIVESPDFTGPANRLLTPSYASPEQIAGAPVSRASDIYSLGIILYELLTGRLPFTDVASKISGETPLPSANIREDLRRMPETTAQLRKRMVGDLDQIVLLCLRRDPRHRYASAAALGDDLQRFLDGRSVIARKEPVFERTLRFLKRRRIAVAAVATVLLFCGIGTWKTVEAEIRTRQVENRESTVKHLLDSLEQRIEARPAIQRSKDSSIPPATTQHVDDVRKLRRALEQDLAPAWSKHPGNTPARQALLDQASHYLDRMRAFAAHDVLLAAELAAAFKDLGMLYEPNSQEHALDAYKTAAVIIQDSSNGDPSHSLVADEWPYLADRIKSLGGTMPVYRPVTILVPVAPSPIGHSNNSAEAPSQSNSPEPEVVRETIVSPPPSPAEYSAVKTRLDSAAARCKSADEMMVTIQEDTARLGQPVAPDIVANHERMARALESARQALDSGDLKAAEQNIGIAMESARRVLKAGGR